MPRLDKTGPFGRGRLSGRGFGFCGMGIGRRIFGRNWPWSKEDKEAYKKALEEELENVKKEIEG